MYVSYDRVSYKKHNVFLPILHTHPIIHTVLKISLIFQLIIRTVDPIFLLHEKFNSLETNMITLLIYLKVKNFVATFYFVFISGILALSYVDKAK